MLPKTEMIHAEALSITVSNHPARASGLSAVHVACTSVLGRREHVFFTLIDLLQSWRDSGLLSANERKHNACPFLYVFSCSGSHSLIPRVILSLHHCSVSHINPHLLTALCPQTLSDIHSFLLALFFPHPLNISLPSKLLENLSLHHCPRNNPRRVFSQ
jgi:hypothetical protein